MFDLDDPSATAEQKMSQAFGCIVCVVVVILVLVVGGAYVLVRSLVG